MDKRRGQRKRKSLRCTARRVTGLLLALVLLLTSGTVSFGEGGSLTQGQQTQTEQSSGAMENAESGQDEDGAGGSVQTENDDGGNAPADTERSTGSGDTQAGAEKSDARILTQAKQQRQAVAKQQRAQVTVTIDLNGGKINGLPESGWNQNESGSYLYTKSVQSGDEISLSNPNREGYEFIGWKKNSETALIVPAENNQQSQISVSEACTLTAQWKEKLYAATFYGYEENQELWRVHVSYGSRLWALEDHKPWENPHIQWKDAGDAVTKPEGVSKVETAWVAIRRGVSDAAERSYDVQVTRYEQADYQASQYQQYYYAFRMEDIPYFTYGGKSAESPGHYFQEWKLTGSGSETGLVTSDFATYRAQYTQKESYLFRIYHYYEDGRKVADPTTVVKKMSDVQDGQIMGEFEVQQTQYYEPEVDQRGLPSRMSVSVKKDTDGNWKGSFTASVTDAFPGDTPQSNQSVSIILLYRPSDIPYKVVYHKQNVGEGTAESDYAEVGSLNGSAKIGSVVTVADRPDQLKDGTGGSVEIEFEGFEADDESQVMLREGKRLEESMIKKINGTPTAVIDVYYNRIYYYLYTLTDTNESDPFAPKRVQYGAELPKDEDGGSLIRTGYTFSEWKWYEAGKDDQLEPLGEGTRPKTMPAHDVYAVAVWKSAKTGMQVVYWFEDANSGSFQNTYQYRVSDVPTGDRLVLDLENQTLKKEDPYEEFPAFTETFEAAVKSKYGEENASYTQYFTFDPTMTYSEEDKNHHATGSSDGKTLHYEIKADGSTTINLYYRRNLYTLQFVIQKGMTGMDRYVATNTLGALGKNGWGSVGYADTVFQDFKNPRIRRMSEFDSTFGTATIRQEYQIADAVDRGDTRAAVGRYGTVKIDGNDCIVYYLTARFEANIADLWPTLENIMVDPTETYSNPYQYISMGTNENSAYWNAPGTGNKNILNQYSTMDAKIVNDDKGKAIVDSDASGNHAAAVVTHQLYAYWSNSNSIKTYNYYYLYEVLDTTLNPENIDPFDSTKTYSDGTIVKRKVNGTDRLYVYRENSVRQKSTNTLDNQNPPAKYGYDYVGKETRSIQSGGIAGNVYFFYNRKEFTLSIYNVNGNWVPQMKNGDFLQKKLNSLTYTNERTGQTETGEKSLAELGWVSIENTDSEKLIRLRYGASLGVLEQNSVKEVFQADDLEKPLAYPFRSMGVNKFYFHDWYKDQENIVSVDWNTNAMQYMIQDQVFYAGWTKPKYRITYALNGGTWADEINMTLMFPKVKGESGADEPMVLYYPHLTEDPNAEVYWYVPEKKDDYLYMGHFYISTIRDILKESSDGDGHYELKYHTLKELQDHSRPKDPGVSSGGNAYLCNVGGEGVGTSEKVNSHLWYIDRHAIAGSDLPEPKHPVRNGYDFLGWYTFIDRTDGETIWLDEVLPEGESIHSYQEESVYLDEFGGAHLLHADQAQNGRLFYYSDQTGYHYRFQFGASVASQDRTLYAAWKGKLVNTSTTMYLVPKSEIHNHVQSTWKVVTINGTEYYEVMDAAYQTGIESGALLSEQAKPLTKQVINDGRVWLPEKAQINMEISERVPEGKMEREYVYEYKGSEPVFRVSIGENENEAFAYYSYFVYHPVQKPTYTVHYIDLEEAVANGALADYEDRFNRHTAPDPGASYLLESSVSYPFDGNLDGQDGGIVTVNAKAISNHSVYNRWSETMQLESDPSGNNIYFYYISPNSTKQLEIHYHFMKGGTYPTDDNVVKVTGYPGQIGQRLDLRNLTHGYEKMLNMAETMNGYANSTNDAQKSLYDRYRNLNLAFRVDGIEGSYAVDSDGVRNVALAQARELAKHYVVDHWTPTGANGDNAITISQTMGTIEIYLRDASLTLKKVDSEKHALRDADFRVQRYQLLRPDESAGAGAETIVYEGLQYKKDDAFKPQTGKTDSQGQVRFYDLSTNPDAGYLYQVTETKAPAGHVSLVEPVYMKVPYRYTDAQGQEQVAYDVTYTVVNPGITYLPMTGGRGVTVWMLIGAGILAGSVLSVEIQNNRRGKKRRKKK